MRSDDRGPVRARVRCAPFPLLRLLTLRCTRRRGAAEGEEAQRTGRGAADDPTRSPADPGDFPVKSSLREMGSRGLSSCGLCRAGIASREPRWISASRPGITGTEFGRAPGAVAHPGRGGASLGRIRSGRAFGSSASHLGRPTSSTHPSSRAPRSVSTSLNPRARTSSRRARGLSDVLTGYPTISPPAPPRRDAPNPCRPLPARRAHCAFLTGSPEMFRGGTGAAVHDDHDPPRDPGTRRATREGAPLADALTGPPGRSGRPVRSARVPPLAATGRPTRLPRGSSRRLPGGRRRHRRRHRLRRRPRRR